MSNLSTNILEIKNLSIGYSSKRENTTIAKDLNLALTKGNLICLLGKNGIGKSTLLKTITQSIPEISGEVLLDNKPLNNYNPMELAKLIGVVFTEKIPLSNLTVYELIALGRQPYTNWIGTLNKEDKKQIEKAVNYTDLHNLLQKRCNELSDGQLQRAMICRVLAQNTKIIILDEPTAHLDVQHKMETFKLLQNLAHQLNKSILVSTHEIQLALQMADNLWLMNDKGIIAGEAKELVKNDKISSLFDSDKIYFDKKKEQFFMN